MWKSAAHRDNRRTWATSESKRASVHCRLWHPACGASQAFGTHRVIVPSLDQLLKRQRDHLTTRTIRSGKLQAVKEERRHKGTEQATGTAEATTLVTHLCEREFVLPPTPLPRFPPFPQLRRALVLRNPPQHSGIAHWAEKSRTPMPPP